MTTFNAEDFLNSTIEGVLATRRPPIPVLEEATLRIKELKTRMTKGDDPKAVLDVICVVDHEAARAATKMEEPTVRLSIFLDLTAAGDLDVSEGANTGLGRLREAVGQNTGAAWSPGMLLGQVFVGSITQRPDPKDAENMFNDVGSIRAIG